MACYETEIQPVDNVLKHVFREILSLQGPKTLLPSKKAHFSMILQRSWCIICVLFHLSVVSGHFMLPVFTSSVKIRSTVRSMLLQVRH